jgi:hypothetical protein
LADGKKNLRYTAFQRRNESMSRRNNVIMLFYETFSFNLTGLYGPKQKRDRQGLSLNNIIMQMKKRKRPFVVNKELEMSKHNFKTVDYEKFKDYLKANNKLNKQLRQYYGEIVP